MAANDREDSIATKTEAYHKFTFTDKELEKLRQYYRLKDKDAVLQFLKMRRLRPRIYD